MKRLTLSHWLSGWAWIGLLTLAGASAAYFWPRTPQRAVIRDIWMNQKAWEGRDVLVAGTLKAFSAGTPDEHYAVDQDSFQIGIRDENEDLLRSLINREVSAEGRVGYSDRFGLYLKPARLKPLK